MKMFTDFGKNLENIAATMKPRLAEIKIKKRFFERFDDLRFASTEVVMIGETSLSCSVGTATVEGHGHDYFPLYLCIVDAGGYASDRWSTLARAGGDSELDRRLSWIFDQPRLRLLKKEESFADSMREDAHWEKLQFYGGIEFSDPTSDRTLQLVATDSTDFLLYLTIKD